ncbi:MAG: hypothetical protein EPN91_05550 [Salinibacterium sp.]|nr:MAG: hypothetical protein EPN91_05550 [Salinibacterium sp.]
MKKMIADGFDIHHVDGNHANNHPANLILMDGIDHMRLHGLFKMARPDRREAVAKASRERWAKTPQKDRVAHAKRIANIRWKRIRADRKRAEQQMEAGI